MKTLSQNIFKHVHTSMIVCMRHKVQYPIWQEQKGHVYLLTCLLYNRVLCILGWLYTVLVRNNLEIIILLPPHLKYSVYGCVPPGLVLNRIVLYLNFILFLFFHNCRYCFSFKGKTYTLVISFLKPGWLFSVLLNLEYA